MMAGSPNRGVIPNINSPEAKIPTDRQMEFNPNGPDWFLTGINDPMGAIFARAADKAARDSAIAAFPKGSDPGERNAFQHGVGSYLLARTLGEERAKQCTDAHEVDGIDPTPIDKFLGLARKNEPGERAMDLYNNRVGRVLPPGGAPRVQEALHRGHLRKRPF